MFVHVPSAWLRWRIHVDRDLQPRPAYLRHPLADVSAKAAAPIGATFTFVALVTGSLWGKPIWGTYWVWDARLTSMFIFSCSISG